MNRSNKGFGLAGVFATVVVLIVAAIFSASANSDQTQVSQTQEQKH
jgi:type II secretory pathway component PulK